jgi:competence protein ComEC
MALVAVILAVTTPRPDVFVAGDGQSVAFRGVNKQLSVLNSGRDVFAIKEWLASDADGRAPKDPSLTSGVACDAIGCVGRLSNGRLLAIAKSVEAIAEDCVRASLVIAQQDAPRSCAALVVDRDMWRTGGAIALRWNGTGFDQVASGSPGLDRPWTLQPKISSPTIKRSEKEPSESEPQSGELEIGD